MPIGFGRKKYASFDDPIGSAKSLCTSGPALYPYGVGLIRKIIEENLPEEPPSGRVPRSHTRRLVEKGKGQ